MRNGKRQEVGSSKHEEGRVTMTGDRRRKTEVGRRKKGPKIGTWEFRLRIVLSWNSLTDLTFISDMCKYSFLTFTIFHPESTPDKKLPQNCILQRITDHFFHLRFHDFRLPSPSYFLVIFTFLVGARWMFRICTCWVRFLANSAKACPLTESDSAATGFPWSPPSRML